MPVTRLDDTSALIVIDMQKALVGLPLIRPFAAVLANVVRLLDAFRAASRLVVLVNADGLPPGRTEAGPPSFEFPEDWTELVPELNAQPSDARVTKRTWSAFPGTGLAALLGSRGVTQVVLAGVATSMGGESTAREAHGLGFDVALAIDAMTDLDAEAHANSLTRIFPHLGETATVADGPARRFREFARLGAGVPAARIAARADDGFDLHAAA